MTMPKIYLSPAYHKANQCCFRRPDGKQCYETLHNNEYLDYLEPLLLAQGFEVKRGPRRVPMSNEDGNTLMALAIRESNSWKADVHYVSHTNASGNATDGSGKATGFRPMYFSTSTKGRDLCNLIANYRAHIYPRSIKCNPRPSATAGNLAELKNTTAVAVYMEHVFHDNSQDSAWFHANMEAIAKSDCKALCEWFKMPYKEQTTEMDPQEAEILFTKRDTLFYVDGLQVTVPEFLAAMKSIKEE